ncbi:hypothetical protein [Streptomyces sp. NPDC001717]|uniref:hypothetical protein n=1 Tax=Streptomyces sp. NPDC001717 TaxID=3364604 RepID=UPI003687195E
MGIRFEISPVPVPVPVPAPPPPLEYDRSVVGEFGLLQLEPGEIGERRRPAVLIRSSPWKAGTDETPWHDVFDLDNGRVRYFGDHRGDHTVRRQAAPRADGRTWDRSIAESDRKPLVLFPAPRKADEAAAASIAVTGPLEELTANTLMAKLRSLKVHQRNGRQSRHKPLALLWGISRVVTGKPHVAPWRQFRDEAGGLTRRVRPSRVFRDP